MDRQYKASLYDLTSQKFVMEEKKGDVIMGSEENRLILYDENEASSLLLMLNDNYSSCFVLLDETE